MASTMFFDAKPQHDGRDHNVHSLPFDATTGTRELADISTEDSMQFALAFWAVSAVELDLFTELAAARRELKRGLHEPQQACRKRGADAQRDDGASAPASCRRLP